jgi:hypothetical protein
LYSLLGKISEKVLEEILNKILLHLENSWKQELLGFEAGSFQSFSRNEQH